MKLSEAIRLGAMLYPQGRVLLFNAGRACALGSALAALGMSDFTDGCTVIRKHYPFLKTERVCPACGGKDSMFFIVGEHLNDTHNWTREHIADWVQGVEDASAPTPDSNAELVAVGSQEPTS